MTNTPLIIAGGGIGGLSFALTLHDIGVPCLVLESVTDLKPLGVGINIQPNAVRELYELGFGAETLDRFGIQTREWALVGLNGREVYAEPRGTLAGYKWPQYCVHRGELQMMLYHAAIERMGKDAIQTGVRVIGYRNHDNGVTVQTESRNGEKQDIEGALLVAADGLHSAVRAQMYPDQPPIQWGGAIMWRGVTRAKPIRTGASFVGFGTHHHRVVFYPISQPDPDTGLADINWIAEITVDNAGGWQHGDWNKKVRHEDFIHHFEGWQQDWIDVPAMLRGAEDVFEYPMIDREPIPTWQDQHVALIGDAAHVMYPTGSNGASQAIMDARYLGAAILQHGVNARALQAFDEQFCKPIGEVVLRNRGAGPFGLLNLLDDRCGGVFEDIDSVIPEAERNEFMQVYKNAAGLAIEKLNSAPAIIPEHARIAV